ncbi:GNAT family N-acetyltransferase [Neobacillus dielmonensis]|uniref:GNAT family N-acetyltransferase n=1 Tax=Neobacillus dielmonensis TaxID=1347369 RepID=UPI0005AB754A|nr:GNAT family N-acetyltransferase [Neobacillus dielmonensis]
MIVRKIKLSDAESYLELCKTLDTETKFMLFEPGERKTTVEKQTQRIKDLLSEDLSTILVCESNGKLVGHLAAIREGKRRIVHSAYIVVGILQDYTGKGIGTQLFTELENWAAANQVHRLELTVMCHNEAAVALYKKMGFEIEGVKRHSLIIDGNYIDEYYMGKLLS